MFFNKNKGKDPSGDDKIKVDASTITTIIGKDTVFEGTLTSDASIRINGTVIGDVRAEGIVILSVTGRIEGTIEAESIIVAGKIEGNMSIRDKVNVEPTGQIYGEIITKKFVIDEESVFEGNCVMNRDGKIIPATPYKKKGDEEEKTEEVKQEDKKPEDKKSEEKKSEEKEDSLEKEEDKAKEDKKVEAEESEEKSDDEAEESEEESEDEKAEEDDKEPEEKDSNIIIADINEIESADDVPTTGYIDSAEVKDGNFRKTSKSLSVEVEK